VAGVVNVRPRLLDLFCGGGGAAMGYHRAGFEVVGVDIAPQPHYPFTFHQGDATTWPLEGFDAIHASPPCTDHSELFTDRRAAVGTAWMLTHTFDRLHVEPRPWVIENVPGARRAMPDAFTLCGRSFGIANLRRHRLFVSNVFMLVPPCACDGTSPLGVYGHLAKNDRAMHGPADSHRGRKAGVQTARDLLDCQWMTGPELSQAIPPAYTEWIGAHLLAALEGGPFP
jgi:DNA (cytosine-5)-methyltransferase 1